MEMPTPDDLMGAFGAALVAVDPALAVGRHLRVIDGSVFVDDANVGSFDPARITVVGIGKAAVPMATAVCDVTGATRAVVATPYPSTHDPRIEVHVGGHPVPDESSFAAGRALLEAVTACGRDHLVIAVVSGGGSAVAEIPAAGVTIADLQQLNNWLLASGMTIVEMNEIRAAVSALKAGRLAAATDAVVVTLVLSDVVGAGPEFVASGPTIPSSLGARAEAILVKHPDSTDLPTSIRTAVDEFVLPEAPVGVVAEVGSPRLAATAAVQSLRDLGYNTRLITTEMTGEARFVANDFISASEPGTVHIATGETTVTVVGDGLGGRNQEAALAVMSSLAESGGIFAALGTDGIDGPTSAAGAIVDSETFGKAVDSGWEPVAELANNNANPLLAAVGALVVTGATGTNVCDLWMWFVPLNSNRT